VLYLPGASFKYAVTILSFEVNRLNYLNINDCNVHIDSLPIVYFIVFSSARAPGLEPPDDVVAKTMQNSFTHLKMTIVQFGHFAVLNSDYANNALSSRIFPLNTGCFLK
jgi:hypothetical protein